MKLQSHFGKSKYRIPSVMGLPPIVAPHFSGTLKHAISRTCFHFLLLCCGSEFPSGTLTMSHKLGIQQLAKETQGFQQLK